MNTKHGSTRLGLLRWGLLAVLAAVLLPMAPSVETSQPAGNAATYIVAFKPANPSTLQTAEDMVKALNSHLPKGVSTHHFRTTNAGGIRIGYICVDGQDGLSGILSMLKESDSLILVDYSEGTEESLKRLYAMPQDPDKAPPQNAANQIPKIISTSPAIGATDIDPETIKEITVTFDQDMGTGMSWTGGGPVFPKIQEGKTGFWRDARTCVLPVQLKEASYYRVGINSKSYNNFRSAKGPSVMPTVIYFTTKGASDELVKMMHPPQVDVLRPGNGAMDIDPGIKEISVMFDMPMSGGMSWVGGGPDFPERPEGEKIRWSEDKMTCTMPVALKPNWQYKIMLNSYTHMNFQNEGGIPLEPVIWKFTTGPDKTQPVSNETK